MEGRAVERVYIGGVEPPRLTVEQVLNRLREQALSSSVEVLHHNIHLESKYVHFDAVTVGDADPSSPSPVEVIRKLFHNVVWKGCKLKVERARPHLLDRLAHEREQRRASTLADEESNAPVQRLAVGIRNDAPTHQTDKSNPPTQPHRRFLRVRSRFQQEAHMVDTKPIVVTSWEDFQRQHRKRRAPRSSKPASSKPAAKYESVVVAAKPQPVRAVHLRFDIPDAADKPVDDQTSLSLVDDSRAMSSMAKSSSSTRSSSSDESGDDTGVQENSTQDGERNGKATSGYVWSDDDDATEESIIDENDKSFEKNAIKQLSSGLSAPSFESVNGSESDSSIRHQPGRRVADSNPPLSDGDDEGEEEASIVMKNSEDSDDALLQKDVESNLHVLAQIFPAIDAQPLKLRNRAQTVDSDGIPTTTSNRAGDVAPGWGASGQILRYDPTRQDASSFVVQAENDATMEAERSPGITSTTNGTPSSTADAAIRNEENSGESEGSEIRVQPPEGAETAEDGAHGSRKHLYHQDKLEAVFREAREEPTTVSQDSAAPSQSGAAFAFSFTLDEETGASAGATHAQAASTPFAFSFGLGDSTNRAEPVDIAGHDIIPVEEVVQETEGSTKRRRLDAPFSEVELDFYIRQFLTGNGGDRILENVDEWRNDEAVKAQWLKERAVLTLDWKRKHKAAKARRTSSMRKG